MSNTAIELRPVAAPQRIGQATAVEQSRAVAEVQAQVIVAQRMPRDIDRAVREMERSCSRKSVAEKAFYRFPRGGQQVSGETVVLAKELARCWGNIDYGLAELRRDDAAGESEMMAFAWDLETNTRPRTTFIVPHVRDKKGGGERLTEARDVYELNTNMGNRRMREMIFNVLPPWFIEDAKALCYKTLANDNRDGATVAERAAKAVERFGKIGVRPEQLAQKLGAPQAKWSPADLGRLTVIFRSIERGEVTRDDEFGPSVAHITAADLAPAAAQKPERQEKTKAPEPQPEPEPSITTPASRGQVGKVRAHFTRLYPGDETPDERTQRLAETTALAGREDLIGSTNDLTADEAATVIRALDRCPDADALRALLDAGAVRDGE